MAEIIEVTGSPIAKTGSGPKATPYWDIPAKIRNTVNGETEVQTGTVRVFRQDEVLQPGRYEPVYHSAINRFGSIEARCTYRPVK